MFRSHPLRTDEFRKFDRTGEVWDVSFEISVQSTANFWRLDENVGVDACISSVDFGIGQGTECRACEQCAGRGTRAPNVFSERHVLGVGATRPGASAQRNRSQPLRGKRRAIWRSKRAVQHVCALYAVRDARAASVWPDAVAAVYGVWRAFVPVRQDDSADALHLVAGCDRDRALVGWGNLYR